MPVTPGPATTTSAGLVRISQASAGTPVALTTPNRGHPAALSGAQQPSRYVGATVSGPPTSGTFALRDFVIDQMGQVWVCTVAGSPGTWVGVGEGIEAGPAVSVVSDPTESPLLVATSPTPPTTLAPGTYHVGYCYTMPDGGRTKLSKTALITIAAGQGISATAPAFPVGTVGVEFYVDDCAPVGHGSALAGGAAYGTLTAQSMQGGGYVAGVSYHITGGHFYGRYPASAWGFFLKAGGTPASKTTLVDFNCGASGYLRCYLNTDLTVHVEFSLNGTHADEDVCATIAVPTGEWLWVAVGHNGVGDNWTPWQLQACVQRAGGITINSFAKTYFSVLDDITYTATLGWGVSQSSTYAHFPVTAGWAMSKFHHDPNGSGAGGSLYGIPSSDWGAGGGETYNCRDATGTVTGTVTDSSGNNYNLTPGALGAVILADGPYP